MKKLVSILITISLTAMQFSAFAAGGDTISDYSVNTAAAAATDTNITEDDGKRAEYKALEKIAQYISELYIDDSYTAEEIVQLGISQFIAKYGDQAIVDIMKGALQSLDPYSDFYTTEEYREYNNTLNNTFYGLGISLQQNGEYVEIVGFSEENGLAQRSGFMTGDKIVKINGESVVGCSTSEVRNLVVGELNTTVMITVLRDGKEIEIKGTRTAVNNTTVSGGIFERNIGYIRIKSFSSNTANEFTAISKEFKEKDVKNLILDLRDNPGGLVSAAIDIAKQLVPKGKIIDVRYRDSKMDTSYYSELAEKPYNIIVLVNENTASAAEILASAVQDSGAGSLLGQNTYGKAVIQSPFVLNNGMVFKLTIGQYITRNGNEINHIGLVPDYEVDNTKKLIDTTAYTKFDFLTPTSLGGHGTNVTAAKERLSVMNYFAGNMSNDVFNTDLQAAVREFQKDNGMTDNGVLDVATQIKIKGVFEMLETTVDNQLQEAYRRFGGNVDDLYD